MVILSHFPPFSFLLSSREALPLLRERRGALVIWRPLERQAVTILSRLLERRAVVVR